METSKFLALSLLITLFFGFSSAQVSISDQGIDVTGLKNPFIGVQIDKILNVNSSETDDNISISSGNTVEIDDDFEADTVIDKWDLNGNYLTNNSDILVLNGSKLNSTIDQRTSDSESKYNISDILENGNLANQSIEFISGGGIKGVQNITFNESGEYISLSQEDIGADSKLLNIRGSGGVATIQQIESPSGGEESTLSLMRGDDIGAPEFIDLFNIGYGNPHSGIRIQSRGSGQLRPFKFQFNDGSGTYDAVNIKPSGNVSFPNGNLKVTSGGIKISGSQYIGNAELFTFGANSNNLVLRGDNQDTSIELQIKEANNQVALWSPSNTQLVFTANANGGVAIPSGNLSLSGNRLVSLDDPENPQDGATKNYVDENILGIGGNYLKNSSGTLVLEESKLNSTIDERDKQLDDVKATDNVSMNNYNINGVDTLNANTKNFVQSINSTHKAVYTSQESAEARAVIEGTIELKNGSNYVDLPRHFSRVVSDISPELNFQATPLGEESMPVRILNQSQQGFKLEQLIGDDESFRVDFRVSGVRKGHSDKKVILTK